MFLNLSSLESKYQEELTKIEEWNYLRNYYRELGKTVNKKKHISIFTAIKDSFYGFSYWFKKYDFVFFSNNERKLLNDGRFYDVRTDIIIKKLGIDKTLLIETPSSGHIKQELLPIKHIVSRRFIDMLVVLFEKLYKKKHFYDILEFIHWKYEISFDYNKQINRFNIQYNIYKVLLRLMKPKFVFLVCYYDKQYIVKAAKELDITVIEIQHGMINKNHSSYFCCYNLEPKYIPNYFLSYGKEFAKKIENFIYDPKHVYPVGNYYLEYLHKNFYPNSRLKEIISDFSKSIAVSLQWTVEDEMIDYIIQVAHKLKHCLFILIPRNWDKNKYNNLDLPNNIIFYPELDCYQIVLHCDYHCTVYSSCAIEAPTLGIPNILVNIDGLTRKNMFNIFNNSNFYIVANTKEEFIKKLQQKQNIKKAEVIKSNESQFVFNYNNNITKIVKMLKAQKEK